MAAILDRIEADELTKYEVQQVRDFIKANEDSTIAILLRRILTATEDGKNINVFADDAELSPNEAAKLLKMSRPHLTSFMDTGHLPYHMVGTHKRIKMSDLKAFMKSREEGAEIMVNALHNSSPKVHATDLDDAALDELNDL
ncbi:helix-turn-helix domain-containing protein [Corynebacterium sp. CCUG 69979]|uniref:helix-turn-helix domain-containing protein n=1 Tax=Corynebacterium sp. CCUG 69979 TaxID=2823890 RepID=UPI00210D3BA4|nr:helix-turn-helix domain-containing protein [Corynebacterium sp. CCUG 69979]MCQ4624879.1 helix-turn-helix domain-containing protein [Corynebacterium sp. CCUG 69979]